MCGIAGIAFAPSAARANPAVLSAMAAALSHRGPDGAGHTLVGRVALVHTRLAIIDIAGGDQPLFAGAAALIANGEIYNDLALRAGLPEVHFASGSDCEPPLHLWLRDGAGYAARLRGMYAIAIHERGTHNLTLSRDRFGIKPLYLAELPDGLAFASEPQALHAAGLVRRGLRSGARDELLQLQFTTGRETIFPGISRVLPGETVRIAGGRVLDRQRIASVPEGPIEQIDEAAALERLDAALAESVALHCRSDVPYGLFLSGGIDSAALLHLMTRVATAPVRAFTAAFDVSGAPDESGQASALARATGARHEVLRIDAAMVWRHLPEIVACLDDPVADYAVIPTWLLARRAAHDVKVILSGEGGDELFAGYGRYRHAMRPWWLGGRPMRRRGAFDGLGVLRMPPSGWRQGIAATELSTRAGRGSRLLAAQESDICEWLPNDLLLKLDRCLMAHGIEGRTPLLDPGVAAAALLLPDALKVRGRIGKWLLRRWLETRMPEARPFAPKQGFTVPTGAWIAEAGSRLAPLVARQPAIAEIAAADAVARLFRNAGGRREQHAAWTLLFYALWHRTHVQGLAPQGDVFETLAL